MLCSNQPLGIWLDSPIKWESGDWRKKIVICYLKKLSNLCFVDCNLGPFWSFKLRSQWKFIKSTCIFERWTGYFKLFTLLSGYIINRVRLEEFNSISCSGNLEGAGVKEGAFWHPLICLLWNTKFWHASWHTYCASCIMWWWHNLLFITALGHLQLEHLDHLIQPSDPHQLWADKIYNNTYYLYIFIIITWPVLQHNICAPLLHWSWHSSYQMSNTVYWSLSL